MRAAFIEILFLRDENAKISRENALGKKLRIKKLFLLVSGACQRCCSCAGKNELFLYFFIVRDEARKKFKFSLKHVDVLSLIYSCLNVPPNSKKFNNLCVDCNWEIYLH